LVAVEGKQWPGPNRAAKPTTKSSGILNLLL